MSESFTFNTGHNWSNGDTANAANLNAAVNSATVSSTLVNSFVAFDGSGNAIDGTASSGLAIVSGAMSVTGTTGISVSSTGVGIAYRPVVLTGNVTVTNSTSLVAVSNFTYNLPVGNFAFSGTLICYPNGGLGTGGYNIGVGGTAGTPSFGMSYIAMTSYTGTSYAQFSQSFPNNSGFPIQSGAMVQIAGTIQVNSSGTFQVQFAQNAASSTASQLLIGSTFQVQAV